MWRKISYLGLFVILVISFAFGQYVNVLKNGGFESGNPALFKAVGATGATLEWAVDASRSASYSLKISKQATSSSVYWESSNISTHHKLLPREYKRSPICQCSKKWWV